MLLSVDNSPNKRSASKNCATESNSLRAFHAIIQANLALITQTNFVNCLK